MAMISLLAITSGILSDNLHRAYAHTLVLFMEFSHSEIEHLSDLFLSVDNENTRLAFELMGQRAFPKILLTEVFAVYKLSTDQDLVSKAETLLRKHGSDRLQNAMNWRLKLNDDGSLYGATEKTIAKNIHSYCDGKELVGAKLAQAMYRKFGVGVNYLLNYTEPEERLKSLKVFISGTVFKLRSAALTKFPPEIFEFPDLTEIDLSFNKIKTIPAKIKVFKNLKVLRLTGNNLKKINKGILQLPELKALYLNGNLMTDFPEIITEIQQLEKLDITGMTNVNMYRGLEIPESIQQLKNIKALGLANYSQAHGAMKYYSPYRNYPHLSWLEVTDEKTLNLEPLALAKSAYQVNGESIAYLLKYSQDTALKKEILNGFYDEASKTMDFKETYLEFLPDELAEFDIEVLNLSKTNIGLVGAHFKTPEEEAGGYEAIDKIRLAAILKLKNLKELILYDCCLSALPEGIDQLNNLVLLDLRFNYLKMVDEAWAKLTSLNRLELRSAFSASKEKPQIPDSFANLTKLDYLSFHFYEMDTDSYLQRLNTLLPNTEINLS